MPVSKGAVGYKENTELWGFFCFLLIWRQAYMRTPSPALQKLLINSGLYSKQDCYLLNDTDYEQKQPSNS